MAKTRIRLSYEERRERFAARNSIALDNVEGCPASDGGGPYFHDKTRRCDSCSIDPNLSENSDA